MSGVNVVLDCDEGEGEGGVGVGVGVEDDGRCCLGCISVRTCMCWMNTRWFWSLLLVDYEYGKNRRYKGLFLPVFRSIDSQVPQFIQAIAEDIYEFD